MLFKKFWAIGLGLLTIGLSSCLNNVDPEAGKAEESNAAIQQYITKNNLTDKAKPTNSGLYYYITSPSSNTAARAPKLGEEVTFTYVLSLLNGQKVDSAIATKPVLIPFGIGAIMPGLEEGLSLMKEGEKATLLMPYYIAYGNSDRLDSLKRVIVPAYSPVRFDVQLVRTRSEDQQIEDYLMRPIFEATKIERLSSGLRIIRNAAAPGTGETLRGGQRATVTYSGKILRTGREFDKGSFSFTLNGGTLIPGFDEGVRNMKKGEKATLIFPSVLGYGANGSYNSATGTYTIPPYSALQFDIEVTDAQ